MHRAVRHLVTITMVGWASACGSEGECAEDVACIDAGTSGGAETTASPPDGGPADDAPMPDDDGASIDGTSSGGPTGDGPTGDGPSSDGPSSAGPTDDGPSSDGPSSDGPSSDAGSSSDSGSATDPGSSSDSDTSPTSTSTSATDSASGSGTDPGSTSSTTDASASGETNATTDPSTTTDSGGSETDDGNNCPGGSGELDFSYIWISNSTQGTVSKIDTVTAIEAGRYLVDDYEAVAIQDCQGPSRTSVNLQGDVAVLDRGGGLAKFYADPDDCPDTNGNGVVDTAVDANYLPWGQDECLAWQIDVPHVDGGCDGPRAVQWTAPAPLPDCSPVEPEVWIAFCNEVDDDVTVWRLDGLDGSLVVEIPVEGYGCSTWGPYGGVVDANNDFWFVDRNSGQELFHVEHGCVPVAAGDCWESFTKPAGEDAYGITIAPDGRIWIAGSGNSLFNFDPATSTWTSHQAALDAYFAGFAPIDSNANNTLRGLMTDADGILWVASIANTAWGGGANPGLLRVDPSVVPPVFEFFGPNTLVGIEHAAGISIDFEGYVWLVDTIGEQAFKIDPTDPAQNTIVTGLQWPYTYSDMTGFALGQLIPL